jgi:hypothetical protein
LGFIMHVKFALAIASLLFLATARIASGEVSVGVKTGDWIEYQVTVTGAPPEKHDVTWAKMEVDTVQGTQITLDIEVKFSDGTLEPQKATLNLETGQLGDDFIIPANLNVSDVFFDKNMGNITITDVEEGTYAGATRSVVIAATSETKYYWDQTTGVLLEGVSQYSEYKMHSVVDKTNLWQPQVLGLEPVVFYAVIVGVVLLVVGVLSVSVIRRKK